MSFFDEATFLNSTVEAAFDTQRLLVHKGAYPGLIVEVKPRQNAGQKDPSKMYTSLDFQVDLQLPADVQASAGFESPVVRRRYSIMVDMNDSGTGLDFGKGKNVGLGQLREAVGQNEPSKPWSPVMLLSQGALWEVKHEMYKERQVDNIVGVGKLS